MSDMRGENIARRLFYESQAAAVALQFMEEG
jgi:hypothetical protein